MPNKKFLEEWPLYKKFSFVPGNYVWSKLQQDRINMWCSDCQSNQTFFTFQTIAELNGMVSDAKIQDGQVVRLVYVCAHCKSNFRNFLVEVSDDIESLIKVGQCPAWEPELEKKLVAGLGKHAAFFHKGVACESEGFGIGAFSYYRRVVEGVIDQLLVGIAAQLVGDELKNTRQPSMM